MNRIRCPRAFSLALASAATTLLAHSVCLGQQPVPLEINSSSDNGTFINKRGHCEVPRDVTQDANTALGLCIETLTPRRATVEVQTPGAFFLGYAWGSKSSQVVFGPSFGLGATLGLPLRRPRLLLGIAEAGGTAYRLPSEVSLTIDLAFSLNAAVAGINTTVAPTTNEDPATPLPDRTQLGLSAGGYIGVQFGGAWYERNVPRRFALVLGVVGGYLTGHSDVGDALLLGFQPALVIRL